MTPPEIPTRRVSEDESRFDVSLRFVLAYASGCDHSASSLTLRESEVNALPYCEMIRSLACFDVARVRLGATPRIVCLAQPEGLGWRSTSRFVGPTARSFSKPHDKQPGRWPYMGLLARSLRPSAWARQSAGPLARRIEKRNIRLRERIRLPHSTMIHSLARFDVALLCCESLFDACILLRLSLIHI